VNASSISTGAYPEIHGLMGNSVFFPKVDPTRFLDTADRNSLLKIEASDGRLLTAPTLGESLQAAGRRMLVVSSGSSGSAFLNNHTVAGGAILHYQYALPAQLEQDMKSLGPSPTDDAPAGALDRYAVEAFLQVGIPRVDPSVTIMWLSDLDSTAHSKGVGAPDTVKMLRQVDDEIGRVEDGLKAAGLFESYDIWVTSDHGFSTHTGAIDLNALLEPFASNLDNGSPRLVTSGGAIYVRDGDTAAISAITSLLQKTPGVGAIFTREATPGSYDGSEPGTLSFQVARWSHVRSAQILFSPDWSDLPNAHGIRGAVAAGGVAGHGSSSPWDVHNTLIAAGPDLTPGLKIDAPSANVDFTPTFLRLLDIPIPPSVQGRPLEEALVHGGPPNATAVQRTEHTASSPDGAYTVTATFSTLSAGGRAYRYLDGTTVTRKP
jgi:arylsulfatase A-like enzyme